MQLPPTPVATTTSRATTTGAASQCTLAMALTLTAVCVFHLSQEVIALDSCLVSQWLIVLICCGLIWMYVKALIPSLECFEICVWYWMTFAFTSGTQCGSVECLNGGQCLSSACECSPPYSGQDCSTFNVCKLQWLAKSQSTHTYTQKHTQEPNDSLLCLHWSIYTCICSVYTVCLLWCYIHRWSGRLQWRCMHTRSRSGQWYDCTLSLPKEHQRTVLWNV